MIVCFDEPECLVVLYRGEVEDDGVVVVWEVTLAHPDLLIFLLY